MSTDPYVGSLDLGGTDICRHGTEMKGAWWHAGVDGMDGMDGMDGIDGIDGMNATYPKLVRSFVMLVSKRTWEHWSATLYEPPVQMASKCMHGIHFAFSWQVMASRSLRQQRLRYKPAIPSYLRGPVTSQVLVFFFLWFNLGKIRKAACRRMSWLRTPVIPSRTLALAGTLLLRCA